MMARVTNRLSATEVKDFKDPGLYADGGNLYFRISGDAKGWMFRFVSPVHLYADGKRKGQPQTRDMGLGSYPTVTLAKARDEADECRRLVAAGIDPIEH